MFATVAYRHMATSLLPRSLRFSCLNAAPIVVRSCRAIVGRLCRSLGLNSRAPHGTHCCLAGFTWLQVFFTQPHILTWRLLCRKAPPPTRLYFALARSARHLRCATRLGGGRRTSMYSFYVLIARRDINAQPYMRDLGYVVERVPR